jgi:glycosyltransferase involved in cell wall biosynthesis
MKPPCILFLLDWRPDFWSTREEFYACLAQRLHQSGITAVLTISADVDPRVRQRMEAAGAELNVLPYNAQYRRYSSYIARIASRYNVLLAHIRFFDYFSLIPWICRLNGIRTIVFTEANSGEYTPGAAWKTALLRLRTLFTTYPIRKAVAISEFIRRRLIDTGIPASKTCVIYNGIDTEAFLPDRAQRHSPSVPPEARNAAFLVVYLSALLPWKRPELLIEICRRLVDRRVPVTILAGGKGPLYDSLVARTNELGLQQHLHWIGYHPEPHRLLQAADVFLHTATGEAFGNVLAEALACTTPVVATHSGATAEVVSTDCGFLVEPGNGEVDALANALERLAQDPALRDQLGLAGRDRACRLFTVPIAVEENLSLYRQLLPNTTSARLR